MATLTDKGTNLSVREAQWSLEKSGDGQVMCVQVRLDGIPSEALQAADVLETVVEVLQGVEWRFRNSKGRQWGRNYTCRRKGMARQV